jgi:hypothetical protein
MAIIIDESFSDDDLDVLEKVEQKKFQSLDVANLKVDAIKLEKNTELPRTGGATNMGIFAITGTVLFVFGALALFVM